MKTKFEITSVENKGVQELVLTNSNSGESVSVIPSLGCRLNRALLKKNDTLYSLLRSINSTTLLNREDIFNNAKLFPFANRIEDGKYLFDNKIYNFPLNYPEEQNSCHGFVYDKQFEFLEDKNSPRNILKFRYVHNGDQEGYPFKFSLLICYSLTEAGEVICTTNVLNKATSKIPFNDGWHPFFTLGNKIDDLLLSIEADRIIKTTSSGIPDGSYLILSSEQNRIEIKGSKFDTVYRVKKKKKVTARLHSPNEDITLAVWQDAGAASYNYTVVYTPPDRKSIAIEPMTSNVNSFNNKDNLIIIAPGETWQCSFGFYIE